MNDNRLTSRFSIKLSEAEDNIIKANVALRAAEHAKAYWERRIAEEQGADFRGEVPALRSAVL
jgi:hypothetical protein